MLAKLGDTVYYKEDPHIEETRDLEEWSFVQIPLLNFPYSIQSTLELTIEMKRHASFFC